MTRVVTELAPGSVPFGVDFLWDPLAAIAIAHAAGATFVREVLTGLYESDMGIWSPSAGEALRFRTQIGAEDVRVFFNVVPEFAAPLGGRGVAQRARSVAVSCLADVILISGAMAGEEPDISLFREVKAVVNDVPLLLNTGAKAENIAAYLQVADGVIVGSSLKENGHTWNPVDPARVGRFMEQVSKARENVRIGS
jgi:membrane complex biogenesis BtpA family protein